jgi:transposase
MPPRASLKGWNSVSRPKGASSKTRQALFKPHSIQALTSDDNHQDMGRSRESLTSKIHAVVDANGLPVHLALTPGEAHDNRPRSALLAPCFRKRCCSRIVDTTRIGSASLPDRKGHGLFRRAKSQRPDLLQPVSVSRAHLVERFFNKIKQCRRVATRYDKLAANYLAFVKLASIRIWLRANESTP